MTREFLAFQRSRCYHAKKASTKSVKWIRPKSNFRSHHSTFPPGPKEGSCLLGVYMRCDASVPLPVLDTPDEQMLPFAKNRLKTLSDHLVGATKFLTEVPDQAASPEIVMTHRHGDIVNETTDTGIATERSVAQNGPESVAKIVIILADEHESELGFAREIMIKGTLGHLRAPKHVVDTCRAKSLLGQKFQTAPQQASP